MSYTTNTKGTNRANFLESEVGLVLKTRQIPESLGEVDGTKKIVPAGTVFPANDNTAEGIIFHDVDVTTGDVAGSVLVAGRVLSDRLDVQEDAKAAMKDIRFIKAPETER